MRSCALEIETKVQRRATRWADAGYLAERRRIHIGVHTCVVGHVQDVGEVDANVQRPIGRELNVPLNPHIEILRAWPGDDVARRATERAGRGNREGAGVEPLIDAWVGDAEVVAVVVGSKRAIDTRGDVARGATNSDGVRSARVGRERWGESPPGHKTGNHAAVVQPLPTWPERQLHGG